jgi:hypothetical protein
MSANDAVAARYSWVLRNEDIPTVHFGELSIRSQVIRVPGLSGD